MRDALALFGNIRVRNGKSAYELAVQNGFVGTLTEWLESLIGAPGTNGIDGDDGREIELRENSGWVEWRYVGDASWTQLFEIPTGGGGSDIISGLGMDFTTNEAVDLGLPSEINGQTENALTETSHTHKLGNVPLDKLVSGYPVEYGAFYNWWAATDARNITSSDDWVVPSVSQYNTLQTYLGGSSIAGGKLKETGLTYWNTPNAGATNETGFNARGTGLRNADTFVSIKNNFYAWCSSEQSGFGDFFSLIYDIEGSVLSYTIKFYGKAIRLLYTGAGTPTEYIGNNGVKYEVIQIGSQFWINCNLNETKYRNGDWITGFDGGVYTPIADAAWAALTTEAMCYYGDDETNGGRETPLETFIANTKHNSLKEIQGGSETERYHLTGAEHTAVQNLGSISTYDFWIGTQAEYDAIDPKDANTIYHVEEE